MKLLTILTFVALVSCKEESSDTAKEEIHTSPELVDVWREPKFKGIGIYIKQYKTDPDETTAVSKFWPGEPNRRLSREPFCSYKVKDGDDFVEVKMSYIGHQDGLDKYSFMVSISLEGVAQNFTKLVNFDGEEVELWRNESWHIGLIRK